MLPQTFTPQLLRSLEQLKLHSRRSFLGSRQGGHVSLKRGHGIEFSDYRKYEPGDDPRRIDWGVYARSDRLYVKQYREEQDMHVLFLLDTSASMWTDEEGAKWKLARDLALALGYVALMSQDSVSYSALGLHHSPNFVGVRAIHEMSTSLSTLKPVDGILNFPGEVRLASSRIRFPGKAIVLSDCLFEASQLKSAINSLRAKNLDITLIQVLGAQDLAPFPEQSHALLVDSEDESEMGILIDDELRGNYLKELTEHVSMIRDFCLQTGVDFISVNTTRTLANIMVEDLTSLGMLR